MWQSISPEQYKEIFEYSDRYKNFLDKSKTEREATKFIIEEAEKRGYVSLEEALKRDIKSGDKIYLNNHNKSCVLFVIGKERIGKWYEHSWFSYRLSKT